MSLILRRSPRLHDQLLPRYIRNYRKQFDKIYRIWGVYSIKAKKLQILPQGSYFAVQPDSYIMKLNTLCDILRLTNKNFPMFIHYGKDDRDTLTFIKTIYNMSFKWLKEYGEVILASNTYSDEELKCLRKFKKHIMKFRVYYELLRNEFWESIVIKYSLNDDVVCLIDSYL